MPARFRYLFPLCLLLGLALSGCGQKGRLYIPPSCSPVNAEGETRVLIGEDGEPLPPCPPDEEAETPYPYTDNESDDINE